MIKGLKNQSDEIFLEGFPSEEEETLWISGRASLEEVLTNEGLSIFSLFSLSDPVKENR